MTKRVLGKGRTSKRSLAKRKRSHKKQKMDAAAGGRAAAKAIKASAATSDAMVDVATGTGSLVLASGKGSAASRRMAIAVRKHDHKLVLKQKVKALIESQNEALAKTEEELPEEERSIRQKHRQETKERKVIKSEIRKLTNQKGKLRSVFGTPIRDRKKALARDIGQLKKNMKQIGSKKRRTPDEDLADVDAEQMQA